MQDKNDNKRIGYLKGKYKKLSHIKSYNLSYHMVSETFVEFKIKC